ncbi:MAG: glycosyltransferase, partial [Paracoccaceae bacterium]
NLRPVTFRALGEEGFNRVVLLHDVIQLDHPDYARPDTVPKFCSKFDVALGAEALIANSEETGARIAHHAAGAMPFTRVLHLGIETPSVSPPVSHAGPAIFTALGTIEPRKNHLMLLQLWRQLSSELGDEAPHLHIVGRRGWANSEVFGILDADPMMGQTVHYEGSLDDAATRALLLRSRALLFPSLAEGFGLPLGEALAMGVPVLASDLPALRELGGDVPEWLPPSDQNAWRSAITDFADQTSALRAAQLVRLGDWQAPCWDVHFRGVENLLETIMVQPVNHG